MSSRRNFLKAALAASLTPSSSWADAGSPRYLAAAKDANGGFALYGLSAAGRVSFRVELPTRGHAAAAHPVKPEAVAFARRPGTFALVINCVTGGVDATLHAPRGRHFMGHGAFIDTGDILVTTENNYTDGHGVLGLWQRSFGYKRIGEVPTHGIGPHDIHSLRDGRLVVANGGILTHPDRGEGREKLNLETMQASLTYLDADLALERSVTLPAELHKNSIRHLAIGPDEQVAFAMQWQGDPFDDVPLIGVHHVGGSADLFETPLRETGAMKAYASSISLNGTGDEVAITSSKGGRVQRFTLDGQFVGAHTYRDISGIAPFGTGYLGSDGYGRLHRLGTGVAGEDALQSSMLNRLAGLSWDNHIVDLGHQ